MTTCTPLIQPITAAQTYDLRHSVLWPDKPADYVKIDDDPIGYHFGAFCQGELIAVISLFIQPDPIRPAGSVVARFRKFATRPDWQRQGVGTALLQHVMAEAKRLGARLIWCDARLDSTDFYRRFGMQTEGAVFHKGPVPYSRMSKMLA